MSYMIRDLRNHTTPQGAYLIDSSVWIDILESSPRMGYRSKQYASFVKGIFKNSDIVKVVPTILLSEVINTYIRKIYFVEFCKKNTISHGNSSAYKTIYRPSIEYKNDMSNLNNELMNYITLPNFHVCGDNLDSQEIKDIISELSNATSDFNDITYYMLAKKQGYKIITDDRDFFFPDVEIFTLNRILLDRAKLAFMKN